VLDVMRQWADGTGLQFVPHTNERRFIRIKLSASSGTCVTSPYENPVLVEARDWCIGHEIGHALGLFHEHQRADRDAHVEVRVPPRWYRTRDQYLALTDLTPCGPYDLSSVMHYVGDRIRPLPGRPITRADNVISSGDRRTIAAMYGGGSCE
jgi:hypothetical protein